MDADPRVPEEADADASGQPAVRGPEVNEYAGGDLFAVDPSVNNPGVALFRGGVLVSAERVKIDPEYASLEIGERCQRVASAIIRWGMAFEMEPRTLVFEWPQSYYGKGKGSQNDLFGL